ncbi:glycoside hydrolase family 76 protein [Teratosphaeria destructans]|uniref:Mannan endo-1,6-alpha-mannosidase n=1 Tax=Teratosphaeria destructans TaxID=418781 RepID=A0A9W7SQL3_9PEZI|nr:glycoside hydrolase family 76 protein [Teratosphaeria destructans]
MRFYAAAGALLLSSAAALDLNVDDPSSVKNAAAVLAHGMVVYYKGNLTGETPGLLPLGYYWWEAGAFFGSLIDYWYYTGDTQYNEIVTQGMLFQVGDNDFMPPNQTKTLGNDDQGFWGLAAMSAAEVNFPNPPDDSPQWLALAQGVFNSQALRWDSTTCGGGLRWQIFAFNSGYNYKNSISNGCFFNLAARLAYYTGNTSYSDWASRTWDWTESVGLIDPNYSIFDGTNDNTGCTSLNHIQWTYNSGVFLLGASVMWNMSMAANGNSSSGSNSTGDAAKWETRIRGLIKGANVFFKNGIMYEVACEPQVNCNTDQQSFKAYLSRWMAASQKLAPFIKDLVQPNLQTSAEAAAKSCSGGTDGVTCGSTWLTGSWDGKYGIGQQMNALEVVQGMLIDQVRGPLTMFTGGTSRGNPSAGTEGDGNPSGKLKPITTADKAGAGILTALVLIGLLGGAWYVLAENRI